MIRLLPGKIVLLFLLIFVSTISVTNAQLQTGKSYVNISKGATGGTFEPGDTLEIRSAIAVGNFSSFSITDVRYNDTIDNNFNYLPNSLKIITNEGLTFRAFSDAPNDDAAMYNSLNKNLRINMGSTAGKAITTDASAATGGAINYNDKPSFYGGVCIMVASFRVQIKNTLPFNKVIVLPGGAFRYTLAGRAREIPFAAYKIALFKNVGSCGNFIGANAVVDNGGTFGSGNTQNRSASAIVPGYSFVSFSSNGPNDGMYGIANNTSATGSTNNGVSMPNSNRVFSVWDIKGDHTGAANPAQGNPATAPGAVGGYMAVVNATYATSPAISQDVSGLCTNTYYDFSAWFRNICSKCSCDSNGKGALNSAFNGPYAPGVKPNLTFQIDEIDYYTTGDLPYTGLWEKKGFTYLTDSTQSAFRLTIRNNSPGGGGNDWAVDDVVLATCEPNVDMNITPELLGCDGMQVDFTAKVRCYFPNYIYYKWQKSINGGSTWIDAGVTGTGTPTMVSGQWQYTAVYPSFVAHSIDSGHRYRVVAASTLSNLASTGCSYSNNKNTMLKVIKCGVVMPVQVISFTGDQVNQTTNLNWRVSNDNDVEKYNVERSFDGNRFEKIGTVTGQKQFSARYKFTDPVNSSSRTFYRLKITDDRGLFKYSQTILIGGKNNVLEVSRITNPFSNNLSITYILPADGKVQIRLMDAFGKLLLLQNVKGRKGLNSYSIDDLRSVAPGMYTATIVFDNQSVSLRAVKVNN